MTISTGSGREIPVRVSSSVFHGHTGALLGVLFVMNDLTELKKLEEQVRRTDRLSSLGTLSAGMAHEIKNPLVSIKTFTQLLPERYEDEEFRVTFFELIGDEIKRIDSIVNRLLKFARPAEANLVRTHLHNVLDESLQLMEQQAKGHGIDLVRSFGADTDMIKGDTELLKQAMINFFLNAIEAMSTGGRLEVGTRLERNGDVFAGGGDGANGSLLHVTIRDTGTGIMPDDVNRIFDPFFTKKPTGTGLGLSVAHGILQEHGVAINVDSRHGAGTTFHLLFPVVAEHGDRE
jgi:two-component system sensor histidine kinase AtoS